MHNHVYEERMCQTIKEMKEKYDEEKKKYSNAGNRTRAVCVKGRNPNH